MAMTSRRKHIRWEIVENQRQFFLEQGLEDPEGIISKAELIKKGHRREVYRHENDTVFIKRMRPRKAKKEWRNWKPLYERGVSTITPVALGLSEDFGYLVSASHSQWAGLYEFFDGATGRQKTRLLEKLGEVVRAMHSAGFFHGDLHGGNFILRWNEEGPDIKMVDFQRGRFCKLTTNQRLANIAYLAVSHFFLLGMKERLAFLTGYWGDSATARNFMRHQGRRLERLVLRRANRVADQKAERFRQVNKYFDRFISDNALYRGVYFRQNRDLIPASFLTSPHAFVSKNDMPPLKDSRSVRIVRYDDICVKYYKRRSPKDVIKGWVGSSKGRRSFRWALALLYRSIPTPEPLCFLDGKRGDSFYLSRFVDSAEKLTDYLKEVSPDQRALCLKDLSSFLRTMFHRGVYHLDLKGTNVLVSGMGEGFRFHLIDTDGMAISWKGSRALLRRSLLRITRALCPYFDRQDLTAFVDRCLEGLPKPLSLTNGREELIDQAVEMEAGRSRRT
jgi:tRNA A-37 threonylcarbamoyl transferase component Bud32